MCCVLENFPFHNQYNASWFVCFKCSYDRGAAFFGQVGQKWQIVGVDKGILGMCVNERRKITVPPHLAYSSQGAGNIPKHTFYIYQINCAH